MPCGSFGVGSLLVSLLQLQLWSGFHQLSKKFPQSLSKVDIVGVGFG